MIFLCAFNSVNGMSLLNTLKNPNIKNHFNVLLFYLTNRNNSKIILRVKNYFNPKFYKFVITQKCNLRNIKRKNCQF